MRTDALCGRSRFNERVQPNTLRCRNLSHNILQWIRISITDLMGNYLMPLKSSKSRCFLRSVVRNLGKVALMRSGF